MYKMSCEEKELNDVFIEEKSICLKNSIVFFFIIEFQRAKMVICFF